MYIYIYICIHIFLVVTPTIYVLCCAVLCCAVLQASNLLLQLVQFSLKCSTFLGLLAQHVFELLVLGLYMCEVLPDRG